MKTRKELRLERAMRRTGELRAEPANGQQAAIATAQAAALTPPEAQTLQAVQLAALPVAQLVDHLLAVTEHAVDEETGEVDAELGDVIDRLNLALNAKVQAYAHVCERLEAEGEALGELAAAYRTRADKRSNVVKRLKARLQAEFERLGVDKVKTPTVTAYLQQSPPAVELTVLDDSEVPDDYCVVERRVSHSRIRDALKAGVQLAFASLTQGRHLRFR